MDTRHRSAAVTLIFTLACALILLAPSSVTASEQERLAGVDRFGTAAQVSASLLASPRPHVLVANGLDFPDGLSGGAAAARARSPLLLVRADSVPPTTATELRRLRPSRITVLGGDQVVSASVVRALRDATGAPVTRWAGQDRYETSAEISRRSTSPSVDAVYVAGGSDFADALSGASVAGADGAPLLLVEQNEVPSAVRAELRRLNPTRIVVLGGPVRVSDDVLRDLHTYGSVTRVDGADRFATSVALSQTAFPRGAETVYLASGEDFPDALAGAPVARMNDAPVLLVRKSAIPATVATELRRLAPERVVALGGPVAISSAVLRKATELAQGSAALPAGNGNRILAQPSATQQQLQRRARDMGANDLFVNQMTPALYRVAVDYGIDPTVMVAQSFHETGGGKFGRAVTPAHRNTCGLKVRNPGALPDDHPDAHARFSSWTQGATAHAQHLYAYAGKALPAGERNVDPRWDWVYGNHSITNITQLGGKWAPSPDYGDRVRDVARRLLAN